MQEWLERTRRLLLMEDVGNGVGSKSSRRLGLSQCGMDSGRAVLTDQFEQFADLTRQRTVTVCQRAQVGFGFGTEQSDESLLGLGAGGSRPLGEQLFFEAFRTQGLAAPPRAGIADDLVLLVVNGDTVRIRFDGEASADKARRDAIAIAVKTEAEIGVH